MLKENKIRSGLSIYDLANFYLGGMDNLLTLVELNPQFESVDVDLEDLAAGIFVYDDQYYNPPAYQFELNTPVPGAASRIIAGLENQSIYDLVIMGTGSLDNIIAVLVRNENKFDLNDPGVTLKECIFEETLIVNNALITQIQKKLYKLSSGVEPFAYDYYRITDDGFARLTDALDIRII